MKRRFRKRTEMGEEMESSLEKQLPKRAKQVWRWHGAIGSGVVLAIWMIFLFVAVGSNLGIGWRVGTFLVVLLYGIYAVVIVPTLRYNKWKYEVREEEMELQYGIFITKRTLVPMVRVQHVDSVQGPILRMYKLASLQITTAATTHEIPALEQKDAEELRRAISQLARVAKEDV
ncbi:PH domain-containing protein [Bacillus fonticola]|uniref:PH domain-containing protein n=1 Tax=Bacillus fonticola TaxID=2728853 RepID=UPI001D1509D5|nr:PH domain-containing protein [Bacillus fonticola]